MDIDETTVSFLVYGLGHPVEIEQRSVVGLNLEPITLCVLLYGSWIDTGMNFYYEKRGYYPSVGLS